MLINTNQQPVYSSKDLIIQSNTAGYQVLKYNFEQSFGLLNSNPNPQAVLDLFGTQAVALFQASQATIAFLQTINPAYVPPTTTNTYTFNADGTVTWIKPVTTN